MAARRPKPGGGKSHRMSIFAQSAAPGAAMRLAVASTGGKKERKGRFRCRGLRQWCAERCEREGTVEPPRYPYIGYYCPLHTHQKPDEDGFLDPKFAHFLETKVPSYRAAEEADADERREAAVRDAELVALMREKRLMAANRSGTKSLPNTCTGADFVRWLTVEQGMPAAAAVARANEMLESGLFAAVSGASSGGFKMDTTLYRLAEDEGSARARALGQRLHDPRCATVRVAIVRARQLGTYNKKKGTSSPFCRLEYRDHGPYSDKAAVVRIGRTNVAFKEKAPRFAPAPNPNAPSRAPEKLLRYVLDEHQHHAAVRQRSTHHVGGFFFGGGAGGAAGGAGGAPGDDAHADGTGLLSARLVEWPRPKASKMPHTETWTHDDQKEPDKNVFEFRVPRPAVVYAESVEILEWSSATADLRLVMQHQKSKGGKDGDSSTAFMGEIVVPIASLLRVSASGSRITAKPQSLMWYRLQERPTETRTEDDDLVSGSVLLRVEMVLPEDVRRRSRAKSRGKLKRKGSQ